MGAAYTALHRHADAERTLRVARQRFEELGDGPDITLNVAKTWLRCAEDRRACGQFEAAIEALDSAAVGMREAGSPYFLAVVHLLRGDIRTDLGDDRLSADDWECARRLFDEARSGRAAEARRRLEENPAQE
ncbi:hypothetical protein ACWCPF_38100 [Streptomyces sp. NPDC001858]